MTSGAACGSKLRLITMLLSAHRFRLNSSLSPQIQALERFRPQIQALERYQPKPAQIQAGLGSAVL